MRDRIPRETMVMVLAHEIGHALEWDSLSKDRKRKYGNVYGLLGMCVEDGYPIHDTVMDFVCEREHVAWDNAEELAQELELDVDLRKMRRLRRRGIKAFQQTLMGMSADV